MPKTYGLLGKSLKHSFSQRYFTEKFAREGIADCAYHLFELSSASELPSLLEANPQVVGLNVTIPYKRDVIPLLHDIDDRAKRIGAVNVIKVEQGHLTGYNSDYFGFKQSLSDWMKQISARVAGALILGSGGASKAVQVALEDLGIESKIVSRSAGRGYLTYEDLVHPEMAHQNQLVVNTTPLGMYPDLDTKPPLPYHIFSEKHLFYDLVYNPEVTGFMREARRIGAEAKNGLEMLHLQAEKSWEIWNS